MIGSHSGEPWAEAHWGSCASGNRGADARGLTAHPDTCLPGSPVKTERDTIPGLAPPSIHRRPTAGTRA